MSTQFPEIENIPADQRQSVMDQAVREVNATRGKMSKVSHYIGLALTTPVVLVMAVMHTGALAAVLVGVPVYIASMLVGIVIWRRSMIRELHVAVARIIATRGHA